MADHDEAVKGPRGRHRARRIHSGPERSGDLPMEVERASHDLGGVCSREAFRRVHPTGKVHVVPVEIRGRRTSLPVSVLLDGEGATRARATSSVSRSTTTRTGARSSR